MAKCAAASCFARHSASAGLVIAVAFEKNVWMYELERGECYDCTNKRGLLVLAAIGNVGWVCREGGDGLVSFHPAPGSLHTNTCFVRLFQSTFHFSLLKPVIFEEFLPSVVLKVGAYTFLKIKLWLHGNFSVIFDLSSLESSSKTPPTKPNQHRKNTEFKKGKIGEETIVQSRMQATCSCVDLLLILRFTQIFPLFVSTTVMTNYI